MSLTGRFLAGLLGLAGLPLAGLLVQQDLAAPWVAVVLLVLYEVVILLGTIVASVAQKVVRRRVEQVMDVVDLALGRRVSRYARYYRRYVLMRDGHINARDLAHTPSHIPELDAVYVDVGLAPGSPTGRSDGLLPTSGIDQSQRQSIHDFLDKEQPAVCAVIGAPGSGKSTLLRHTARLGASQGKRRRRRVPVMVALRDHAEKLAADPTLTLAALIRADTGTLAVAEPGRWWEVQLNNGNCLILLDGLDEVARSDDRAAVAEWIEKQIAKNPKNDFVITSRPHGYRTAVIPQATVLQVRPFTTEQIRQFVHGWCRAAERLATAASGPEIDQRATEEAEDLIGQLSTTPALLELAVNPLLLTMMVLVHRERRSLPVGRADLYNQVCDVMLWRRQESKKLEVKPPGAVRQRILAALAYELMVAETRDCPKSQVIEVFDRALRQIDTDITAEGLLTAIVESSGLLVEREKNLYSFAHHTIGEYLASTHIRGNNLAATLIRSVDNPWWRETTLLYVTDADASAIVEACLDRNTGASLSLAIDCLWSHGQLDRELRGRLDRLLEEAFEETTSPERRRLVASALAAGHLSKLVTIEDGSLVCPHPITEDLYWLFCKDTGTPFPGGTSEWGSDPTRAAAGMWKSDAESFASWINAAAVEENSATFRLPTRSELEFVGGNRSIGGRLDRRSRTIWTADGAALPAMTLRTRKVRDPYVVSADDIYGAVKADLCDTSLLVDFILAGVRLDARTLDLALETALAGGPTVDFTIIDEVGSSGTAFNLPQAMDRNLELVREIADDPARSFDLPRGLEVGLVQVQARDLVMADSGTGDFALLSSLARGIADTLDHSPQFGFNLNSAVFDAALRDVVNVETRYNLRVASIGTALAKALTGIEQQEYLPAHNGFESSLATAFATTFVQSAGVVEGENMVVGLDLLSGTLRSAYAVIAGRNSTQRSSHWEAAVASHLISEAEPVLTRTRPIATANFANIRIPSLMLAAEAVDLGFHEDAESFRQLAAGVTLLEKRAKGKAPLETIILVRE
ncbi:NACHT domain-containing protein [Glycomyces rhizosphaerae]|uniref:NACHT domain-containing protein n=1 Tax=Glycomyces rhizosphaerae TaxID=2054422 RepID=A0ABV7PRA4_9ACTN